MQESTDNDYREFLTWQEELLTRDKEELVEYILRLEAELYANMKENEELPW